MVELYDAREPSTLEIYCDFLGITKQQFYNIVEPMRDQSYWKKDQNDEWQPQDAVSLHEIGGAEENVRVARAPESERTMSKENRRMYYNSTNPPVTTGDVDLDEPSPTFKVI